MVDDEPEIVELMSEMLEGAGHEVMTASPARVALAMLAEARFDAIISDPHTPGPRRRAAVARGQAPAPALARRMLFVTGDTLSASARQFFDETRCTARTSPFAKADLLSRVRQLLDQ